MSSGMEGFPRFADRAAGRYGGCPPGGALHGVPLRRPRNRYNRLWGWALSGDQPILFESARKRAEEYASDPKKVSSLLEDAQRKAERNRGRMSEALEGLQSLCRLINAWLRGKYTVVPWRTIVLSIAGIIYFVNPLDLIPDLLPIVGFLDDAGVLAFVLHSIRKDLDRFLDWERLNPNG